MPTKKKRAKIRFGVTPHSADYGSVPGYGLGGLERMPITRYGYVIRWTYKCQLKRKE
jgi:hypothetical protein